GMGLQYVFFKKALDRLQIRPQIFYAGKFKSATEPFREEHMTDPNRLQSRVLLEDLYQHFLDAIAKSRSLDTAGLRRLAGTGAIRSAEDAVKAGLCDGMRYEDEVKEEIRSKSSGKSIDNISFMSMAKYASAVSYKGSGKDRIALIYAAGDIVDGTGSYEQIGGDRFRRFIRKARLDKDTRAIVIRINSGGGSAMASENMWREIALAKKDKPVVVSYGDVAASGGYYMACNADSIFALPNTITGSIGVFSIIPNLQGFLDEKLGVTFDGVETGPFANSPSIAEPLTDLEKKFMQESVDSIYHTFLTRVADGRRLQVADVDSIGQGRVWTGNRAIKIGLVDRIGTLDDALAAAAKLAKIDAYRVREYPEPLNFMEKWKSAYEKKAESAGLKHALGKELFTWYRELEQVRSTFGQAQAKMPFRLQVY
ncbi:MAG: signal peptide peptidase SppA, partial [Flavihumibacter sp.]